MSLTTGRKLSQVENLDDDSAGKDSDGDKSVRSKKSMSVYSGVAKSMRGTKLRMQRKDSGKSIAKKERRSNFSSKKAREEELPQPIKINIPERKVHNDDLSEQHFVELRNFLYKKQRQEAIAAKMSARGRGSMRAKITNDDISSPGLPPGIDREILADVLSGNDGSSPKPSKRP